MKSGSSRPACAPARRPRPRGLENRRFVGHAAAADHVRKVERGRRDPARGHPFCKPNHERAVLSRSGAMSHHTRRARCRCRRLSKRGFLQGTRLWHVRSWTEPQPGRPQARRIHLVRRRSDSGVHEIPMHMAVIVAGVLPAAAQRLPGNVSAGALRPSVEPDLAAARFAGHETIAVTLQAPATAIVLNAAEIEFGTVQIAAAGRTQTAKVTLEAAKDQATFTVPATIPAGEARIQIDLHRHPERRTARLVSEQGEQPALRGDAARGDRRAPHVPVVRRAGVQGDVRAHRGDRRGDRAISNGAVLSDTPGPGQASTRSSSTTTPKMSTYLVALAVGDFVCHEGAADGIPIRICSTPDKKGADRVRARVDAADRHVLQPLLLDQVPVQEARHRRRAGFRRRRDGEHRGDLLSRDAAAGRREDASVGTRRRSPRCSRTRWRTSGSAIW